MEKKIYKVIFTWEFEGKLMKFTVDNIKAENKEKAYWYAHNLIAKETVYNSIIIQKRNKSQKCNTLPQ